MDVLLATCHWLRADGTRILSAEAHGATSQNVASQIVAVYQLRRPRVMVTCLTPMT
jgi:hypothetical protein